MKIGWKSGFGWLQKIGKSLMLPVSVLPAAGILLGVGSARFSWLPDIVSTIMAQSGGAIFSNLALIFAIGVALGVTNNDGVAALAAVIGYAVMIATMGVMAPLLDYEPRVIMGITSIETGVFGGILIGMVAALLFNRFYRLQLPPYLGFFAGKRSVPILTGFAAILVGIALSLVWPPIGNGIDAFSHWAASGQPSMAFALYGVVERSLIPFGLHHIWNVPFFFEVGQYVDGAGKVIRGEIYRFTAGDPTAGNLAGGYLFKMWGLPAAALAIWQTARPENRAKVGGIMISAALTSFLTGITEPIEFSFLFVAPLLYAIHALLAGVAYFVCIELGIRHSTTFSHGLIDYIVLFPNSSRGLWYLWLGPIWAAMYYTLFRTLILRRNLKTPGREVEETTAQRAAESRTTIAAQLVAALGGRDNIAGLDACITRLRVELKDPGRANPDELRRLGASGVVQVGNSLQAVYGTRSENLKTDIEEYLGKSVTAARAPLPPAHTTAEPAGKGDINALVRALGGRENIVSIDAAALTRLRVQVRNARNIDEEAVVASGAAGVMHISDYVVHVIVGKNAEALAAELKP